MNILSKSIFIFVLRGSKENVSEQNKKTLRHIISRIRGGKGAPMTSHQIEHVVHYATLTQTHTHT